MNDKKTSEDEFVDENFEDEFEFGDEESKTAAQPPAPPPFKGGDPRKFMIIGIAIAVIGFIGYFGYRFFTKPSYPEVTEAKLEQLTSSTPTAQLPMTKKAALPEKSKPAAITEADVGELLNPKGTVTPGQTGPAKTAPATIPGAATSEPAKTAETKAPTPGAPSPEPAKTVQAKVPGVITPEDRLRAMMAGAHPAQTTAPASTAPPTAAEMQNFSQQTQKTLEAFSKLNQQMESNLNQIKYLDAYTREVSLNVEKLNTQISAMDNRVQSLSNLANSLSKDLSKVRNEVGYVKRVIGDEGLDIPPAPTARKQRNVEYPYPAAIEDGIDCNGNMVATRKKAAAVQGMGDDLEYVVHAVIPGRAWLKSAKGQIITVTEGEIIGNYGKILVIDASNGVVLTSSGVTFR